MSDKCLGDLKDPEVPTMSFSNLYDMERSRNLHKLLLSGTWSSRSPNHLMAAPENRERSKFGSLGHVSIDANAVMAAGVSRKPRIIVVYALRGIIMCRNGL